MASVRCPLTMLAAVAALSACSDTGPAPNGSRDTIPPFVTELQPAPLARDVPVNTVITVRFSEPINNATVGPGSFLVRRGFDTVAGSYAFEDSSASFVPDVNFDFQTPYNVTVTRGIRDPAGNQLARDTAWPFQTGILAPPAPGREQRRAP